MEFCECFWPLLTKVWFAWVAFAAWPYTFAGEHKDLAAWIQAVGSVVAIVWSSRIANKSAVKQHNTAMAQVDEQHKKSLELLRKQSRLEILKADRERLITQQAYINTIFVLVTHLKPIFYALAEQAKVAGGINPPYEIIQTAIANIKAIPFSNVPDSSILNALAMLPGTMQEVLDLLKAYELDGKVYIKSVFEVHGSAIEQKERLVGDTIRILSDAADKQFKRLNEINEEIHASTI